ERRAISRVGDFTFPLARSMASRMSRLASFRAHSDGIDARMGPLDLTARRSGSLVDLPPRSGVSETMTRPHDGRCILIDGRPASGKSGLAFCFAERFDAVVSNAVTI